MRTRAPYLEHCPQCVDPVPCRPLTKRDTTNGITAQYRCPACLHSWRTGWQRDLEDRPVTARPPTRTATATPTRPPTGRPPTTTEEI